MFTYYTHIPNSEAPTAEIAASSTKHARTTYLDYLSRGGLIGWKDRQTVRPLVKVSRMQPGEFRTEIKLDYDQRSEAPVQEVEAPPGMEAEERLEEQPFGEEPTEEELQRASKEEMLERDTTPSGVGRPQDNLFLAGKPKATPQVQPGVQSPYAPLGGGQVGTRPGQPAPPSAAPDSPIARLSRRSKGA